jgi:hypothetical protein
MMFGKYIQLPDKRVLTRIATTVQEDERRSIAAHGVVDSMTVDLGPMPLG